MRRLHVVGRTDKTKWVRTLQFGTIKSVVIKDVTSHATEDGNCPVTIDYDVYRANSEDRTYNGTASAEEIDFARLLWRTRKSLGGLTVIKHDDDSFELKGSSDES